MTIDGNVERFSGFADCYDANRPQPPAVLVDILTQLAQVEMPKLVVDLGCGTGLSTRTWSGRAKEIIGIEPNADMRGEAEARTADPNISYCSGLSHDTGLPDGCADIVTCSQALHWMEPESTFAEVFRILRPSGVFAAIDCDWPPVINWEVEAAYMELMQREHKLEEQHGIQEQITRWPKTQHLTRMQQSGRFRFTREICMHNVESGNVDRLVGLAMSQGSIESLLKLGLSEDEIGLTELRNSAERVLGNKVVPWYISYRMRIGIK